MPKTYKNNTNRAILGIQPGETGELEDAAGFVGPEALEVVEESKPEKFQQGGVVATGGAGPVVVHEGERVLNIRRARNTEEHD